MIKTVIFSANTSWYLFNFRGASIKEFKSLGYEVVCIAPKDDYSKRLITDLGCIWEPIMLDNKGANPLKDIFFMWELIKVYKRYKPIIVFNFTIKNNIYGTWAAKAVNTNVVNNVSGLGTSFINKGFTSLIVKLLYRLSQPMAHKVFCQNEEDYELLISNHLVPKRKLELLPGSGVNLARFTPSLLNNKNDKFVFLYVGRMLADKGLYELIAAAEQLYKERQDFTVQLCGFVGAKNSSAILQSTFDEWVKLPFVDYLGSSDIIESVYAKANCVVLPSYREGMPRSLLEAGAMGLVSITTDVPGCRNIITHDFNGFLCEVKSSQALALQMQHVLGLSSNELLSLGGNARDKVAEKFDEAIVINKYVQQLMLLQ